MKYLYVIIIFCYNVSYGQDYTKQINKSPIGLKPIEQAVKVDAFYEQVGEDVEIRFRADNKSYYRCYVDLRFEKLVNMTPRIYHVTKDIIPGDNILATYTVTDKNIPVDYLYKTKVSMRLPDINSDYGFPYLLPFNIGKKITLSNTEGVYSTIATDTIVASRRGYIAGLPEGNIFEPIFNNCIEIVHKDRTIGTYKFSGGYKLLVTHFDEVLPGQPIAVITSDGEVTHKVYEFPDGFMFKSMKVNYVKGTYDNSKESKIIVSHPVEVVTKEMKKREIKNYLKGKK